MSVLDKYIINDNYFYKIKKINKNTLLDLKIQKKLNKVINNCPHFSILYKFVKFKNKYLITYNELANGDLKIFLEIEKLTTEKMFNTICQIFLALMFFYQEIKMIYNDSHDGNFLFHKIKKQGYFHYNLFGKDYYLKNMGYLWKIIDFEYSVNITNDITYYYDYSKILYYFLLKSNRIINNFYNNIFNLPLKRDKKGLIEFMKNIIKLFEKNNVLLTNISKKSLIFNKNPYTLNIDR